MSIISRLKSNKNLLINQLLSFCPIENLLDPSPAKLFRMLPFINKLNHSKSNSITILTCIKGGVTRIGS